MKRFFLTLFLGVFLSAVTLQAAVFSLRPDSGRGLGGPGLLGSEKQIWNEPVVLNGFKTRLKVDVCDDSAAALFAAMQRQYSDLTSHETRGVRIVDIRKKGGVTRIMLFSMNGLTLRYTLELPETLPHPVWPRDLPQLSGASPIASTVFPERGTSSVQFILEGTPENNISFVIRELESKGWLNASAPGSSDPDGTGCLMLSSDGKQLLNLGLGMDLKTGKTAGSLLVTTLK